MSLLGSSSTTQSDDRILASDYSSVEIDSRLVEATKANQMEALTVRPHKENGGVEAMQDVLTSLHGVQTETHGRLRKSVENVSPSHSFEIRYARDDRGDRTLTLQYVDGTPGVDSVIQRQLQSEYRNSLVETQPAQLLNVQEGQHLSAATLALRRYTLLPIESVELDGWRSDPTGSIMQEMVGLADGTPGDGADVITQVMFKPARRTWLEQGVENGEGVGDDEYDHCPSLQDLIYDLNQPTYEKHHPLPWITEKIEHPPTKQDKQIASMLSEQDGKAWRVFVRVLVVSDDDEVARRRTANVASMFKNFYEHRGEQTLLPQPVSESAIGGQFTAALDREWEDCGIVKTESEVAGLVNVPSADDVETNKMRWSMSKPGDGVPPATPRSTAEAEEETAEQVELLDDSDPGDPIWFGRGSKHNVEAGVYVDYLDAHMFACGATRYGKTTFLQNFSSQFMSRGQGGMIIDPKGQDADDFIREWPEDRDEDDLIVMDLDDEYEKIPRFNFLEIPPNVDPDSRRCASIIEAIADDLTAMVAQSGGSDNYLGALMKRVTKAVARGLLRSGRSVHLLDLACAVSTPDGLSEFRSWMDEERIAYIRDTAKRFEKKEDTDLEPLAGRMDEWIHNDAIRDLISARDPSFSIHDMMTEGKVLVVRFPRGAGETERRLLTTALVRRTYCSKRLIDDGEPFYLVCDEFDKIATEQSNLHTILSEAGGFNYRCVLSCQAPASQLPDRLKEAIENQVETFITFNPGGGKNAGFVAQQHTVDKDALTDMPRYKLYMRVHDRDHEKTHSYLVNAFKPIREARMEVGGDRGRSDGGVESLKRRSMEKYGMKIKSPLEQEADSHFRTGPGEESNSASAEMEDAGISDKQAALVAKAAYDEWLRRDSRRGEDNEHGEENRENQQNQQSQQNEDSGRWVPADKPATQKRVGRYLPSVDITNTRYWDVIEQVPDGLLEVAEHGGEMVMRCTEKGKNEIFRTGSAGSAGGGKHRMLLKDGYGPLFRMGLVVSLPTQAGDDMPDGVADLSDVAMLDLDFDEIAPQEAQHATRYFRQQYPLLDRFAVPDGADPVVMRRSKGPAVAIEAESSTGDSKPAQSLFNLAQAYNEGKRCLYTAREGVAETLWQTLTTNGYYSHRWSGEYERCYNGGELVIDDQQMLRPKGARETVWLYDEASGEYLLRDSDGEEHGRFASAEDVFSRTDLYPATSESIPDDQADEWVPVYRPFIPDFHFEHEVSPDAWDIIVVPEGADRTEELRLYRGPGREQVPVTEVLDADQSMGVDVDEGDDNSGGDRVDAGAPNGVVGEELSDEQRGQMETVFSGEEDDEPVLPEGY